MKFKFYRIEIKVDFMKEIAVKRAPKGTDKSQSARNLEVSAAENITEKKINL